jgi:hypothetical protein
MIIYIIGYGRSASTVLSQLLEKKLNAINLGEIKFLYRDDFYDLLDPYWVNFKADNKDLIAKNANKLKGFDNAFGFLKFYKKNGYKRLWDAIFSRMGVDPDDDIIIDNSKSTFNSYMRGFYLYYSYDEVYFVYPHRKFWDVMKSRFTGKNANLERGKKKSFIKRFLHIMLIGIPHILLTRGLCKLYYFWGMQKIEVNKMELEVDEFIEKYKLEKAKTHISVPMIYGNRSRKLTQ